MILILLTILKITGIILLVLLGLIVLLLCLLLFAPVQYQAKGAKHPDELSVRAFISYLWPLVRVGIEYPSQTILSVKILWIDLLRPKEKKSQKKKKSGDKRKQGKPEKTKQTNVSKQESVTAKPMRSVPETPVYQTDMPPEAHDAKKDGQPEFIEIKGGTENASEPQHGAGKDINQSGQNRDADAKSAQSEKKRGTDRKTHKSGQKKTAEKSAAKKKKAAPRTEKDTENRLVAIAALLWQYKEMYPDVLRRVFRALKSILPRKCNIHLIFGTGSPDNTGYLYGAYCALREYLPGTIVFEPVWMESCLDVEFELNGNIRLIHFVTAAVKIIADKRVRKFISEVRRL